MTALDRAFLSPDFFHLLYVQTFESAIEIFVGLGDEFCVFTHGGSSMRRFRRDEHQGDEALVATIGHAVMLPGRGKCDLTRPQLPLFFAHLEHAFALKDLVDFILTALRLGALFLTLFNKVGLPTEP